MLGKGTTAPSQDMLNGVSSEAALRVCAVQAR
jgi:hypothetical protein